MEHEEIREIKEILKVINEKIDIIDSKVDLLSKKTENVEKDCDQMRDHIQFVESTYNVVRKPLNYLTNRINCMLTNNGTDVELPQIKSKKKEW